MAAPFLLFPTAVAPATILALLLIAGLFILGAVAPRRVPFPTTPFNAALLLFAIMMLVGMLVSADPDLTLPKATGLLLGIAAWRWLAVYARPAQNWPIGLVLLLLAGIGFTLLGLLNADWLAKTASDLSLMDPARIHGLWQRLPLPGAESGIHPNQTAAAILIYLPLLLVSALWLTRQRKRGWLVLGWLAFAFGGLALLMTQSRSGWLGALAAFGLLVLLTWLTGLPAPKRWRCGAVSAVALTLLSMAGLWTIARTQSSAAAPTSAETVVGSLSTLDYRWAVWPWALEAIDSFAYTGTGLGTFRAVGPRLYPILVPPGNDFGHAHNQFLQVAVDVGLPGLIAYAALLLVALMVGWRVAVASAERRPFVLALLAGLVGLHVYGLTDALALGAKPGLLFWMALGLMGATASVGISAERG